MFWALFSRGPYEVPTSQAKMKIWDSVLASQTAPLIEISTQWMEVGQDDKEGGEEILSSQERASMDLHYFSNFLYPNESFIFVLLESEI